MLYMKFRLAKSIHPERALKRFLVSVELTNWTHIPIMKGVASLLSNGSVAYVHSRLSFSPYLMCFVCLATTPSKRSPDIRCAMAVELVGVSRQEAYFCLS